jgi:putative glycosyltransferase (TIGR04348 family)
MPRRSPSILIVTPAPTGSRHGNRVTALRWARLLRSLSCRVKVATQFAGQRCDVLVALHARRSADSIAHFRTDHPQRPLVVALTGTDLYRDLPRSARAKRSLELADRLIVLQAAALDALPPDVRGKAVVIYQSAERPRRNVAGPSQTHRAGETPAPQGRGRRSFDVCLLGHLRAVKDPFRAALAARRLPGTSRIRVLHLGAALTATMERRARREQAINPRYRWRGVLPRHRALRILSGCRLLVLTSRMEGGANAVSEAIVCGVPVVSSRIAGSVGLLGEDYPGYFPVGDTQALARLLARCETDRAFYARLASRCRALVGRFTPEAERAAWRALLDDLFP